jgi:hypothetical protein
VRPGEGAADGPAVRSVRAYSANDEETCVTRTSRGFGAWGSWLGAASVSTWPQKGAARHAGVECRGAERGTAPAGSNSFHCATV